jgi:hypothetical protein
MMLNELIAIETIDQVLIIVRDHDLHLLHSRSSVLASIEAACGARE